MDQAGKLILIIGPSGVGKSIIIKKLKLKHPALHFPKSATTRIKRKGEGNDLYHFVSENEFDDLSKNGKLLEWAVVHGGARYGTLTDEILPFIRKGKIVIREVDVQGFDNIRSSEYFRGENSGYKMESIFILPENKSQLVKRIKGRAPISEQELNRRIASMEQELSYADECNHQIVNKEGKLDETIKDVEGVLY
jgi:guanylate kinase